MIKDVYQNVITKEFSFEYNSDVSVCVGETDGTLEDWVEWSNKQQVEVKKDEARKD